MAELGGERYSVFAREQTGRGTEIIYGFSQHNAGGYTLVYEEDSFENSAGAWLCFSLVGPEPEEGAEREQIPCFYDVERELFRMGMPAQIQE